MRTAAGESQSSPVTCLGVDPQQAETLVCGDNQGVGRHATRSLGEQMEREEGEREGLAVELEEAPYTVTSRELAVFS